MHFIYVIQLYISTYNMLSYNRYRLSVGTKRHDVCYYTCDNARTRNDDIVIIVVISIL